ncbi:M48 family metallopeptidase [Vibrio gallaecicus]|uniref:M48 family metallopeptidase n=1 Tax=Vibrio gallaecicus TaxID=552386 RepID=UPI0010C9898B|nr:M48 family metallopeptidase [Vibrio gallaecicus]MDN3615236.1 M48 family metallopeptidase [Vibrio gallaecicus]
MISGVAHPPRSSERCEAILDTSQSDKLILNVDGSIVSAYFERVEIMRGVGSAPTKLKFPDGWQFITDASDELDTYLQSRGKHNFIGKLEKNITTILVSSVVLILLTISMFTHGIPWLTHQIVTYLPDSVPKLVENQVLESLDDQFFESSTLSEEQQHHIRQRFENQLRKLNIEGDVQLVFRSSELGANAFALSAGTIIVLDDLVRLTETDEQLDSILLHELGHVQHQHVMKILVRSSLLSVSVAVLTGESSGIIDNLTGLGVFIANNGQSQDAEREADAFASDSMIELHGSNQAMIEMFELLGKGSEGYAELPTWLSTHPELDERVELLRAAH